MESFKKQQTRQKTTKKQYSAIKTHIKKSREDPREVENLIAKLAELDEPKTLFSELPISKATLNGLTSSSFVEMTEIQRCSLGSSLRGSDVLGAAKTGSGKTLAFLITVLENLYRNRWSKEDGLGALILTPTRELALQIFQVLRSIGKFHSFSAGLIIGGKDFQAEQERISQMNILIATPGRLLQHLDQSAFFQTDNLQILVLDEADRILDLGFSKTVNAILAALPKSRQTLLFSATQNASVADLARLSLSSPKVISVHEKDEFSTPSQLEQFYCHVPLESKLDYLFSFLRANFESKILVFVSSCKQVRFITEAFKELRPGIAMLPLFGKQKQEKRMAVFKDFCSKKHACLVATDIAARGLDFPKIDWVLQLDCPEDPATYIHRVGRTARFDNEGKALLFLLPSESKMLELLALKKVPLQETKFSKLAKVTKINQKLMGLCCQTPEMKYLAQKSLISYVRSVYLQKDKAVFQVSEMPIAEYAYSIGLPGIPKLKFLGKSEKKNENRSLAALKAQNETKRIESSSDSDDASNSSNSLKSKETTKNSEIDNRPKTIFDKFLSKKNTTVFTEHYAKLREADPNENDDFLRIAKKDHEIDLSKIPSNLPVKLSKRDLLKSKKKYRLKMGDANSRLVFNEEGEAVPAFPYETEAEFLKSAASSNKEDFMKKRKLELEMADATDKEKEKERKRLKKEKRRKKDE